MAASSWGWAPGPDGDTATAGASIGSPAVVEAGITAEAVKRRIGPLPATVTVATETQLTPAAAASPVLRVLMWQRVRAQLMPQLPMAARVMAPRTQRLTLRQRTAAEHRMVEQLMAVVERTAAERITSNL
jgi:hypothetical protein